MEHLNGKRAFDAVVFPSYDGLATRGTQMEALVDALTDKVAWQALRMEGGMSYYVRAKHVHSRLFAGFGYTVLQWCAGSYQATDTRHDRLNARSSIAAVRNAHSGRVHGHDC